MDKTSFHIYLRGLKYYGPQISSLESAWALTFEKWKFLAEREGSELIWDGGRATCGLCMLFWPECVGCPIYEVIGRPNCRGTPQALYGEMDSADGQRAMARAELYFLGVVYAATQSEEKND